MIGLLTASTFWQFQQFQQNFSKLSISLPNEIASKAPNTNDILNQILNQSQSITTNATTTSEFITPDKKLKLDYPADWQEKDNIPVDDNKGKLLFAVYETNDSIFTPAINYLFVEEINASSTNEITDQYKKDAEINNYVIKITSSETINGGQTTNIVKIEYQTIDSEIIFSRRIALIDVSGKIYSVSIITRGNDETIEKTAETIFDSINTNVGQPKNDVS